MTTADQSAPDGSHSLRAEDLYKSFGKTRAVQGVTMEVQDGEVVALLGRNGAGKTTTFHMIVGLVRPDRGEVFVDEERISNLPMYQRARKSLAYLPQESSIFRRLSVEENLLAILEFYEPSRDERLRRAHELLEELGVDHLKDRKAYTLSGGERRRVEISRALITSPKFLLLDEPFAGIDPMAIQDLQGIIRQLKERGMGILITDHNARDTLTIADRAYLMLDGQIGVSGPSNEVAENKRAQEIYLGEGFTL